jgi:O-antigen/teichoic acid export membrane protein
LAELSATTNGSERDSGKERDPGAERTPGVERTPGAENESERHRRDAYIWNTAGSMLNAFQSVIMLMVITRTASLTEAGVFTLAYASANLFLTVGNFGMRNFQASDVRPVYPFASYLRSRLITDVAMLVTSTAYLAWSAARLSYDAPKVAAIFVMSLLKLADSIDDITNGNFQQHGRLDVAGRFQTLRVGTTIVAFCLTMVVARDLVTALVVATAWTMAFYAVGIVAIRRRLALPTSVGDPHNPRLGSWRGAWALLRECLPLFLAAFLLYYVGNAPKYAIDATMDDASQAIYGFIAMPVFVVGLLAQFVYMPLVEPLSRQWGEGDRTGFRRQIGLQVLVIVGLTLVCDAGGALLGEPVLGLLYATDLAGFGGPLVVLVTGGGLLALATLFTTALTIMRDQRLLTPGYALVALVALVSSGPIVERWGIPGASVAYLIYMAVLASTFAAIFLWRSR